MDIKQLKKMGLSHSRRIAFGACKRRFWYLLNNWYYPMSGVYKNALFGNIIHYILERILTIQDYSIKNLLILCNKYCEKNPRGLDTMDRQYLENEKTLVAVVAHCYLILWYSKEKNVLSDMRKTFQIRMNEQYLKRQNINGDIHNIKIDKVLIDRNNHIWILDHKCKGRFNIDILRKKLIIDEQTQLYRKGFETKYKRKVYGIIQDIIKKPELRMTKKLDNNEIPKFMERVKNDILNDPKKYFIPIVLPLRDEYCKNFDSDLKAEMKEIYACLQKGESAFTKRSESCDSPYTCDFLEACTSGNMDLYLKNF